jgi:uncharacterized protein YqgV (UPF0045/DUF77 family)
MQVSAQVSLYPLGQSNLGPAIEAALRVFKAQGLDYRVGSMSTLVAGEDEAVFEALRDAFQAAAAHGGTVMAFTVSNACPAVPSHGKPVSDA